jgi:ubiquinone/menaquinone biosynthesis C-methylase UbiE
VFDQRCYQGCDSEDGALFGQVETDGRMEEEIPNTAASPLDEHNVTILDQFTRQARTFGEVLAHAEAIDLLHDICGLTPTDTVLDVACGPGLLALDFARDAAWVTGLDSTPKMLEAAQQKASEADISNVTWTLGDAYSLPFEGDLFSVVVSRYAFHHYQDPRAAFAEMVRVTRPGGRVLLADVRMDKDVSATFDRLERTRDGSHVHALTPEEHTQLWAAHRFSELRECAYTLEIPLQVQLEASFLGSEGRSWESEVKADLGQNRTGYAPRKAARGPVISYPVGVVVGKKTSPAT